MNSSGEKKKKHVGLKVLIGVVVIIALFLCLIGFITDFLWFKELDYVSVFFTKLLTQLKIGVPTFIIVTFLAYVYLKFLKRGYFKKVVSNEVTDHRRLNLISWGLAGLYGAITTFFAVKKLWFLLLQFINSTGFDKTDPLYDMDISFYVFKLNFIEEANQLLIVLLIAFALLTVIYYSVLLSVRPPQIFDRVDDAKDDADDDEDASGSGYDGQTAGGQFGGFDNINDMFGKFAKSFQNGGKSPFQRAAKPKKQLDLHRGEAAHHRRSAVLPDGRYEFLPQAVRSAVWKHRRCIRCRLYRCKGYALGLPDHHGIVCSGSCRICHRHHEEKIQTCSDRTGRHAHRRSCRRGRCTGGTEPGGNTG